MLLTSSVYNKFLGKKQPYYIKLQRVIGETPLIIPEKNMQVTSAYPCFHDWYRKCVCVGEEGGGKKSYPKENPITFLP